MSSPARAKRPEACLVTLPAPGGKDHGSFLAVECQLIIVGTDDRGCRRRCRHHRLRRPCPHHYKGEARELEAQRQAERPALLRDRRQLLAGFALTSAVTAGANWSTVRSTIWQSGRA